MNILKYMYEDLGNHIQSVEDMKDEIIREIKKQLNEITGLEFSLYSADTNTIQFIYNEPNKLLTYIYVNFSYENLKFIEVYDYTKKQKYYDIIYNHFGRL